MLGRGAPIQSRRDGLRRLTLLSTSATENFKHLPVERRNIVRLPAGYQISVDHNFLVHPLGAGIAQVGLQRWPRGDSLPARPACLDYTPRAMADHCDRFILIEESLHKFNGLRF